MRIRMPIGRTLYFVAAFLFALVALLPLRLALDWMDIGERGLAAREARGSIWMGALAEAQYGNVPLGDVTAELRTLPLLIGRARVDLERREGEDRFRASATVRPGGFSLDDMRGRVDLGAALAPLPVAALDLADVSARFADGLCASASGTVQATMSGEVAGVLLPGGMSGNARCEEGALLLPLAGQSGMEALNLRIYGDGRFRADLIVRAADEAVRARLMAAGFVPVAGGYAARVEGSF